VNNTLTVAEWAQGYMCNFSANFSRPPVNAWVRIYFRPYLKTIERVVYHSYFAGEEASWTRHVHHPAVASYYEVDGKQFPFVYGEKALYTFTYRPVEYEIV
jgi:hypothetical protein